MLFNKTRLLAACIALSVLAHVLSFYAWKMLGTYDFAAPVNQALPVMVDLAKTADTAPPAENQEDQANSDTEQDGENVTTGKFAVSNPGPLQPSQGQRQTVPEPTETSAISTDKSRSNDVTSSNSPAESRQPVAISSNHSPLSTASDFLATKNEKLTYLISIFGIPVGSAVLESKNENGEICITLRVTSNIAISSVFPVDDSIETRHIGGRFIMTKIKQREGSFRSDEGFTINLNKKRIFWFDNIRGNSLTTTVSTDEVLDTLSGFYSLRNRQLQIDTTEMLHIYDSETYAEVPVEILRRETMRLPNLQKVDTLVIRPLQKTAGIFRRTGDIMIWLTDDAFKVPVKIVTSVALGTVTVELVSSESTHQEDGATKNK